MKTVPRRQPCCPAPTLVTRPRWASRSNGIASDYCGSSGFASTAEYAGVSIQEYTREHPELADEILELFPTLALLENYGVDDEHVCPVVSASETPREIGDYRIIREVRRGGMGVVYEAEHESMHRRVALKVLQLNSGASDTHLKPSASRDAPGVANRNNSRLSRQRINNRQGVIRKRGIWQTTCDSSSATGRSWHAARRSWSPLGVGAAATPNKRP